jgi:hypothetical protein
MAHTDEEPEADKGQRAVSPTRVVMPPPAVPFAGSVTFVAPPHIALYEAILQTATQWLAQQGDVNWVPGLAVVLAQTACEVYGEGVFDVLLKRRKLKWPKLTVRVKLRR